MADTQETNHFKESLKLLRKKTAYKINSAGKSWKEFWDKPMTVQYAYSPYEVVGNGGKPNETTQRRGDIAKEAVSAASVPAIMVGAATAGVPATIGGLALGAGGAYAGGKVGEGVGYILGTDENGAQLLSDVGEFVGGLYGGIKGAKYGKANSSLGKGQKEVVAQVSEDVLQPMVQTQPPISNTTINPQTQWVEFIKQNLTNDPDFGKGVWHIDHINNNLNGNILIDGRGRPYTWWDEFPDMRSGRIGSHLPDKDNIVYFFPRYTKGFLQVLDSPRASSGWANYKSVGPIDISDALKYKWDGHNWINFKQGGTLNYLSYFKSGGGIHIKPENKGKFTEYCGGNVTDECIQKAKHSGNKKLIKRAVFAENARKWN